MVNRGFLWVVAALASSSLALGKRPQQEPKCDLSAATRLKIHAGAQAYLKETNWELLQTGVFAALINPPGDTIAGNPNTMYSMAIFNDTEHNLTPANYPPPEEFKVKGGKPPVLNFGNSLGHNEAMVLLLCMPPRAKYMGITAYVTGRIIVNDTDGSLYTHAPLAEVSNPFNYMNLNTTAGTADERKRREDTDSFFGSVGLMVFTPSTKIFEEVARAYVAAGLDPWAINFYPISAQEVRLHDRRHDVSYDYPDLLSVVGRISYFQDQEAGVAWAKHTHPVYLFQSPLEEQYFKSVPEPLPINDVTGDSEVFLNPTIEKLIDVIIEKRTDSGLARLVKHEQLVSVPNDKGTRIQCLNNVSFVAAVDPVMTSGCGFGTRDCRYGTSAALDMPYGEDLFFVVVGVKHEQLQHSSYSSLMLTSLTGYEQGDHTITFRETDGAGAPRLYLPDTPDADLLYSVTVARSCPPDEAPYCIPYTKSQFQPDDIVYWMERAYLQWSTGAAPNIDEYVMSHILTFQGKL